MNYNILIIILIILIIIIFGNNNSENTEHFSANRNNSYNSSTKVKNKVKGVMTQRLSDIKKREQKEDIYSTYPVLAQQDNGVANSLDDINADIPDKLTDCVNDTVGYKWDIASLKMEKTQLTNEVDSFRKILTEQDGKINNLNDQITQMQSQNTIARSIINYKDQEIDRLNFLINYANFQYKNCIESSKKNITT